jgi:hypothetical protein
VVDAAGVDTWSVCWYLRGGSTAEKAIEALATVPAPRSKLMEERILGHRVGWFPGTRMLYAEGHPAEDGLCKTDALPGALDAVAEALADRGVLPPSFDLRPVVGPAGLRPALGGVGFGGVRRLDSTVDLRFGDPREGLAALSGVAALALPRVKTQVIREVGGRRVETVYLRGSSGRTVLGRWYDKGIESGEAARGLYVRPEDQRRFAKDARLTVDAVAQGTYVRDAFVKRFEPLWRAAKGVKVAGVSELAGRLGELQDEGVITAAEAKRLAGYLALEAGGGLRQSRATQYRDRAACRNHGLVLADGVLDEVEVDLGEVLERAMDSEAWGASG